MLSHAAYALFTFVMPLLVAAAPEAGVALVSDYVDRRRLVVAGQAALAASLLWLAWTRQRWGLTLGLALAGDRQRRRVRCGAGPLRLPSRSRWAPSSAPS
jgi:hypothetical protein